MNDHSYKDYYFVNCPTVICSPHHYLLSRELPLVNLWPPGLFSVKFFYNKIAPVICFNISLQLSSITISFNLVTSKTRGLTTLLPSWVQANSLFVSRCC